MLHLHTSGPRDEATRGSVLFVHGYPFNATMWAPQLAALPDGWRGIAPDLRGFGASPLNGAANDVPSGKRLGSGIARADEPVLTMARLADDIAAVIEEESDGPAVVCGLSMGGYVTFELLRRHPDRVRAVVLVDTRAAADSDEGKENRLLSAQMVRSEGTRPLAVAMLPQLLAESTREENPELVETVRAMILDTPVQTVVAALAGMASRHDSTGDLGSISVPALVVVGAEDAITPPAEARRMAEAIPGAELAVISGAGHVSNLEAVDAFNSVLGSFLNDL